MQMCRYFDVEEKFVPLTEDCFVMTPEKMIEAIDENTIGALYLAWLTLQACSSFVVLLYNRFQYHKAAVSPALQH